MDTSAVLKPLGGWYSSHWSVAPASLPSRPFTITSSSPVQQPLAGLRDLHTRAVFLLGVTRGVPGTSLRSQPLASPHTQAEEGASGASLEIANYPSAVPRSPLPVRTRGDKRPWCPPETGPVKPFLTHPGPTDPSSDPKPVVNSLKPQGETTSENLEEITARAEVLIEAVNRLGSTLKAHEFLAHGLREYGAALISRFAETLSPLGLRSTGESLTLDREQLAKAYQENPGQVVEAFWGQHSLTPELASLAAAIVGAPGVYLMESNALTPETHQPFQPHNPWFRVAPAHFYEVA